MDNQSTNMLGNESEGHWPPPGFISLNYNLPTMIVVCIVLVVVIIATAFGNFLVGLALFRYHYLRTISNFLIGNLALSDFLLATTVLPISTVNECLGYWVFGRVMCTVWLLADVLYCTASLWNLGVIAFDRFTATLYPVWYREKRSTKQAVIYIAIVWCFSAAICTPPLLGWIDLDDNYVYYNNTEYQGLHQCKPFRRPAYVLYSALGSFFIPFIITVFFYIRIFSLLRQRMQKMKAATRKHLENSTSSNRNNHHNNHVQGITLREKFLNCGSSNDDLLQRRRGETTTNKPEEFSSMENIELDTATAVISTTLTMVNCGGTGQSGGVIGAGKIVSTREREETSSKTSFTEESDEDSSSHSHHKQLKDQSHGKNSFNPNSADQQLLDDKSGTIETNSRNKKLSPSRNGGLKHLAAVVLTYGNLGRRDKHRDNNSSKTDARLRVNDASTESGGGGGEHLVATTATDEEENAPQDSRLLVSAVPACKSKHVTIAQRNLKKDQSGGSSSKESKSTTKKAQKKKKKDKNSSTPLTMEVSVVDTAGGATTVDKKARGGVSQKMRFEQREMRATIRMAIIIAFFFGMWIGFFTTYLIGGWCGEDQCGIPPKLDAFFFWLGYSNSCINPILYTIFNDEFRRAFQKILGCYRPGQRGNTLRGGASTNRARR